MQIESFVHNKNYYEDSYDLNTIEECLRIEEKTTKYNKIWRLIDNPKLTKLSKFLIELKLYYYEGDRYAQRKTRIEERILKDQAKQDYYSNTREPVNLYCRECGGSLIMIDKLLEDYNDQSMHILFIFKCKSCTKRRCVYDNGSDKLFSYDKCDKCSAKTERSYIHNKSAITVITKCISCDFKEKFTTNLNDADMQKSENRELWLLKEFRNEYCLSDDDGSKYLASLRRMDLLSKMIMKKDEQSKDPVYKAMNKIRKLSISELMTIINTLILKKGYAELQFDKPEIDKTVVIPFLVQDTVLARNENDSIYQLRQLLCKELKGTNWRLMTQGITYRLGYLSGKLKGYDREEDLYKLAQI
jgi:hypothetical protein